jgi:glucose-1-phosphate adenylyltransferase
MSVDTGRFVSRLTRETLALVLAGGRGSRLGPLTDWRAKPGVPFGGKFRIIDFPLSNCVNSGIRRVGVLTQYKAHSLIRHIQKGWGFFRGELGEFVELLPAQQRTGGNWYRGTADAVLQNTDIIRGHEPSFVLILAGDHVYKMDYGAMLAEHVEKNADITVGCVDVPVEEASAFGVMAVDDSGRVRGFQEKPANPAPIPGSPGRALASMGIYIFDTDILLKELADKSQDAASSHDFGKDILPSALERLVVQSYPFRDPRSDTQAYWRDVGTVDSYWRANLELVDVDPELNLYDNDWPIWTYQEQLPPAKFVFNNDGRRGMALDSMVAGGCIISGSRVDHSMLFSNVRVHSYCEIEDAVILPEVEINRNCRVRRAVIDKGCKLPQGLEIGYDAVADRERFYVTDSGIVLVTPEMLGQAIHHND